MPIDIEPPVVNVGSFGGRLPASCEIVVDHTPFGRSHRTGFVDRGTRRDLEGP